MVFYFIGLGLGDEKDITVRGLEAIKGCKRVYLEHYTAIIGVPMKRLEAFYGCDIILADREAVESGSDDLLKGADKEDVAFLVVGDVFAATTHTDLFLRAARTRIPIQVIHNCSIMNAVSACGMQLYTFGTSVSICFFEGDRRPGSFYEHIKINRDAGMHTLCLLDIKVKEQSFENMSKGLDVFEPPRYMTVNTAIEQLLEIEDKEKQNVYARSSPCIGLARVGQTTQKIVSGTMEELLKVDFGGPLHCMVLPGTMDLIENEMYEFYHWDFKTRECKREEEKNERDRKRDEEEQVNLKKIKAKRAIRETEAKERKIEAKKKLEEKNILMLERMKQAKEQSDSDSDEEPGPAVDLDALF